jgi:hypothetical protein
MMSKTQEHLVFAAIFSQFFRVIINIAFACLFAIPARLLVSRFFASAARIAPRRASKTLGSGTVPLRSQFTDQAGESFM